jgi:hypothetical protein
MWYVESAIVCESANTKHNCFVVAHLQPALLHLLPKITPLGFRSFFLNFISTWIKATDTSGCHSAYISLAERYLHDPRASSILSNLLRDDGRCATKSQLRSSVFAWGSFSTPFYLPVKLTEALSLDGRQTLHWPQYKKCTHARGVGLRFFSLQA